MYKPGKQIEFDEQLQIKLERITYLKMIFIGMGFYVVLYGLISLI